jgi:hypothetical protein
MYILEQSHFALSQAYLTPLMKPEGGNLTTDVNSGINQQVSAQNGHRQNTQFC